MKSSLCLWTPALYHLLISYWLFKAKQMKSDEMFSSCSDRICFSVSCESYHFTLVTADGFDQTQSQNVSGSMGSGASNRENVFLSFVHYNPAVKGLSKTSLMHSFEFFI